MDFPKNFKLLVYLIAGSHMYGTNTPESDVDVRGVFIPSKEYFLGFLDKMEHIVDEEKDITYYELRKFLILAMRNNPSIIESLFVHPNNVYVSTIEWRKIVEHREYFLSMRCKDSFSGYAQAQLKKIKSHRAWLLDPPKKKPERKDYGLPKDKKVIPKEQMGAFNAIIAKYLSQIARFHELREHLEKLENTYNYKTVVETIEELDSGAIQKIVPMSDNLLDVISREKAYANAMKHWKQYINWKKNRNPERAKLEEKFGYDTKHAMHLYRMFDEGKELLIDKKITFPRPNREHLLQIRNGLYTYEQLIEDFSNLDKELDDLAKTSSLPKEPDERIINDLCIEIVEAHFNVKIKDYVNTYERIQLT